MFSVWIWCEIISSLTWQSMQKAAWPSRDFNFPAVPPVHAKLPMFIYAAARCICTCSETWFTEQVYFCRIFLQPFRKLTKAACAIFMVPIHRSNFLKEAQLRWYYLMAADKHYDILTMKPLRTSYYIIYVRR